MFDKQQCLLTTVQLTQLEYLHDNKNQPISPGMTVVQV